MSIQMNIIVFIHESIWYRNQFEFSCQCYCNEYAQHTVLDLITAHTRISAQSSNFVVFKLRLVYFYLLLYKSICCLYSFEAVQMNITTYAFMWSGLGLLMEKFCHCFIVIYFIKFWWSFLLETRPYFCFRMITWVNINGFSPNLVCVLILWRSGLGLRMGKFHQILTELSAQDTPIFSFPDDYLNKCQGILTKLDTCIDIWKRSGLGLLMGKFHQCLTELSAHDKIMAGYNSLKFLLVINAMWNIFRYYR